MKVMTIASTIKNSPLSGKVKAICELKEITDRSIVKQSLYVVSEKNGIVSSLVYADNDFNNSDRVRASFAKENGVKFTDTRCCRIKNVKYC